MSGSDATLRWRRRGRDENPTGAFVILAAAVLAGLFGRWMLGQAGLFLGSFVVLLSTADFLFGRWFELTPKEAKTWVGPSVSSLRWTDVAKVIPDGKRLLLLPAGVEGWRRSFRGIALEPSLTNRAEVESLVRERIPSEATYEA